jgi:hypothetical protein
LKKVNIRNAAGAGRLSWPTVNTIVKIVPEKMVGIVFVKNVEIKNNFGQNSLSLFNTILLLYERR